MKEIVKIITVFWISFVLGIMTHIWLSIGVSKLMIETTKATSEKSIAEKQSVAGNEKRNESACNCDNSLKDKVFLENYFLNILKEVPIYPGSGTFIKEKKGAMLWHKLYISDTVDVISSWYSQQMKLNGWDVSLDVSEPTDSMVIYSKVAKNGEHFSVGVRVKAYKNKSSLTLILYPNDFVVPTFSCVFSATDFDK